MAHNLKVVSSNLAPATKKSFVNQILKDNSRKSGAELLQGPVENQKRIASAVYTEKAKIFIREQGGLFAFLLVEEQCRIYKKVIVRRR